METTRFKEDIKKFEQDYKNLGSKEKEEYKNLMRFHK